MKLLLLSFFVVFISFSQEPEAGQDIGRSASYRLGKGDIVTMNINLWGHVQKPGAYEMPITFGLPDLISHAGGPANTANLDEVRIVRKGSEVITVNLTKFIMTGDESVLVKLQPGDTVVIGGTLRNVFSEVLGYVRDLLFVVSAIKIISQ